MTTRFIKKLILLISIIICIFATIGYVMIGVAPIKFGKMYQYAINAKYEQLINADSPKVIVVGGSATGFGLNESLLSETIKRPVANLGLHAGFGSKFVTNMAKENIKKGDIVVLAYEYGMWEGSSKAEAPLLVTAMDGRLDMYKYIPDESINDVIKYMPTYIFKKIDAILSIQTYLSPIGVYSRSSFDAKGSMVFDRKATVLPEPLPMVPYNRVLSTADSLSLDFVGYVNDLYSYANKKGADVVVSFPSLLDEGLGVSVEDLIGFQDKLKGALNAPVISNVKDYIYSRDYMYDTIYHCNNNGEKRRTMQLAEDLSIFISNK